MASRELPTILLIHGGGHGNPAYMTKFEAGLQASGFPTVGGTSPSNGGVVVANRALQDDAVYWRKKIEDLLELGKNIIIFAHSIGSFWASEAAHGLSLSDQRKDGHRNGVLKLVFLGAYLPDEGDQVFTFYNGDRASLPTRAEFFEVRFSHLNIRRTKLVNL